MVDFAKHLAATLPTMEPPVRDLILVYDTEANGFYEDGTIMWCIVIKDIVSGQRWEFGGPEGLEPHRDNIRAMFQRAKVLICHNQIKHDLPQLC